jgi:hypothetical protein
MRNRPRADHQGTPEELHSPGSVLRPETEVIARYIGAEIDLLATYNFTLHLLGYGGYSYFFTRDYIRKTGPSKHSDFFYSANQYTFRETTSEWVIDGLVCDGGREA